MSKLKDNDAVADRQTDVQVRRWKDGQTGKPKTIIPHPSIHNRRSSLLQQGDTISPAKFSAIV